jgi:hypothetical protein
MSRNRDLVDALGRWGHEPTPLPDPFFTARLGRVLTQDDAIEVDLDRRPARVVTLRRRVALATAAATAAVAVATAAVAVGSYGRVSGVRVDPADDPPDVTLQQGDDALAPATTRAGGPPTSASPSTPRAGAPVSSNAAGAPAEPGISATSTTAGDPTATAPPGSAAPTTVLASPTLVEPRRSTSPPNTAPAVPGPPHTEPTTVGPITPEPTTVGPLAPEPTSTGPPTTSTEPAPVVTMSLMCATRIVDTRTGVVCEWSENPGGAASYRILKGIQSQHVGRVLNPTAGLRRYVDYEVTPGEAYSYVVQALNASGTLVGQSNQIIVACCVV